MKFNSLPLKSFSVRAFLFLAGLSVLNLYSCKKQDRDPRVVLDRDYKTEILAGRDAIKMYMLTNAPGGSISVSIDGKTVWSEGFGYANAELKAPAKPETKFRIGRSSQMFTSMLIARLQEEGKLNIDSTLNTYIPEFPKKQFSFTLRNLGTHSAGFPETGSDQLFNKKEYKSLKDYAHSMDNDSLSYPPNQYFAVSDYGTCLLGVVAEHIEGKPYPKLVEKMLLDTLGLKETVFDNPSFMVDNRSTPYYQNFIAQVVNAPFVDQRFMAPAYGFLSTSDDLNKLGQIMMKKEFFNEDSYKLFFTPNKLDGGYVTNLGFGWQIFTDKQGREVYIQQGNTIGGTSFLAIFPEQKLVVALCTNLADNSESLPTGKIVQLFLDKIDPAKKEEVKKEEENKSQANEQNKENK